MAQLNEILPQPRERAFICGKTGSGKTALAEQICSRFAFVVALDPKRMLGFDKQGRRVSWLDYKRVVTLSAVIKAHKDGAHKIIYAPTTLELQSRATMERFFEWVFKCGNWLLYVDELTLLGSRDNIPFYYKACYMQGRELGITTITSTQRPTGIAGFVKSESERAFIFRLNLAQDRENVFNVFGIDQDALKDLPKHQFFYMTEEGDGRGPLILNPKHFGG